ncbi:acyl-CoA N-acyltransferase, partial [Infundibulicybe gibba]
MTISDDGETVLNGRYGFWVAVIQMDDQPGEEIVGCIGLDHDLRPDVAEGSIRGQVRRMNVSSDYRRRGIGGLLLETVAAQARKSHIRWLSLITSDYSWEAKRMYERNGCIVENR